jgi:hypothetical protein
LAHSADQRPEWSSIIRSPSTSEAVEGCGAWSWPSRPGEPQHGWEPPRVVDSTSARQQAQRDEFNGKRQEGFACESSELGNSRVVGDTSNEGHSRAEGQSGSRAERKSNGHSAKPVDDNRRQAQPPLGGDAHGPADWMDYAELYTTCDNRTDELRLLGNGVVPATAERAFRTLLTELLTNKTNI